MLVLVNLKRVNNTLLTKCLLSVCGPVYFILSENEKTTSITAPFFAPGESYFGGAMKVSVCIDIIVQDCDIRTHKC